MQNYTRGPPLASQDTQGAPGHGSGDIGGPAGGPPFSDMGFQALQGFLLQTMQQNAANSGVNPDLHALLTATHPAMHGSPLKLTGAAGPSMWAQSPLAQHLSALDALCWPGSAGGLLGGPSSNDATECTWDHTRMETPLRQNMTEFKLTPSPKHQQQQQRRISTRSSLRPQAATDQVTAAAASSLLAEHIHGMNYGNLPHMQQGTLGMEPAEPSELTGPSGMMEMPSLSASLDTMQASQPSIIRPTPVVRRRGVDLDGILAPAATTATDLWPVPASVPQPGASIAEAVVEEQQQPLGRSPPLPATRPASHSKRRRDAGASADANATTISSVLPPLAGRRSSTGHGMVTSPPPSHDMQTRDAVAPGSGVAAGGIKTRLSAVMASDSETSHMSAAPPAGAGSAQKVTSASKLRDSSSKADRTAAKQPGRTSSAVQLPEVEPEPSVEAVLQSVPPLRSCHCRKSQCLKLYCDCFAAAVFCAACSCSDCYNRPEHKARVMEKREAIIQRDPKAFTRKIQRDDSTGERHKKGCNCKRSHCLKKYCECYQGGVLCSDVCKCLECHNQEERPTSAPQPSRTQRSRAAKAGRASPAIPPLPQPVAALLQEEPSLAVAAVLKSMSSIPAVSTEAPASVPVIKPEDSVEAEGQAAGAGSRRTSDGQAAWLTTWPRLSPSETQPDGSSSPDRTVHGQVSADVAADTQDGCMRSKESGAGRQEQRSGGVGMSTPPGHGTKGQRGVKDGLLDAAIGSGGVQGVLSGEARSTPSTLPYPHSVAGARAREEAHEAGVDGQVCLVASALQQLRHSPPGHPEQQHQLQHKQAAGAMDMMSYLESVLPLKQQPEVPAAAAACKVPSAADVEASPAAVASCAAAAAGAAAAGGVEGVEYSLMKPALPPDEADEALLRAAPEELGLEDDFLTPHGFTGADRRLFALSRGTPLHIAGLLNSPPHTSFNLNSPCTPFELVLPRGLVPAGGPFPFADILGLGHPPAPGLALHAQPDSMPGPDAHTGMHNTNSRPTPELPRPYAVLMQNATAGGVHALVSPVRTTRRSAGIKRAQSLISNQQSYLHVPTSPGLEALASIAEAEARGGYMVTGGSSEVQLLVQSPSKRTALCVNNRPSRAGAGSASKEATRSMCLPPLSTKPAAAAAAAAVAAQEGSAPGDEQVKQAGDGGEGAEPGQPPMSTELQRLKAQANDYINSRCRPPAAASMSAPSPSKPPSAASNGGTGGGGAAATQAGLHTHARTVTASPATKIPPTQEHPVPLPHLVLPGKPTAAEVGTGWSQACQVMQASGQQAGAAPGKQQAGAGASQAGCVVGGVRAEEASLPLLLPSNTTLPLLCGTPWALDMSDTGVLESMLTSPMGAWETSMLLMSPLANTPYYTRGGASSSLTTSFFTSSPARLLTVAAAAGAQQPAVSQHPQQQSAVPAPPAVQAQPTAAAIPSGTLCTPRSGGAAELAAGSEASGQGGEGGCPAPTLAATQLMRFGAGTTRLSPGHRMYSPGTGQAAPSSHQH